MIGGHPADGSVAAAVALLGLTGFMVARLTGLIAHAAGIAVRSGHPVIGESVTEFSPTDSRTLAVLAGGGNGPGREHL